MDLEEEESVYFASDNDSDNEEKSKTMFTQSTTENYQNIEPHSFNVKDEFSKALDNLKEKPIYDSKSELTGRK